MISNLPKYAVTAINRIYLPMCMLLCAALAYDHVQLIMYEMPLDLNETGMLSITQTIADGGNPYSLENQPSRASVYPILYNSIVAPFSLVFGNTLQLHRLVAGVFIVAACCLLFIVTNKASKSPRDSFPAATMFYAGLLYYSTPVASPNGIGILLFLSTLFIPWLNRFSNRSLLVALLLGVMSFYGKQYFVACLGYVALYIFIGVSKKKGLIFGISSLVVFLTTLVIVSFSSPYFLDNTIFSVGYVTAMIASNQALLGQLYAYGKINLPILMILGFHLLLKAIAKVTVQQGSGSSGAITALFNLRDIDAPLLTRRPDYFWYCMVCSMSIVVLQLGKNPGNHETYLFQLVSPFLLAGTFITISRRIKWQWLYQLLAMMAFYSSYFSLPHDYSMDGQNWRKLQQVTSSGNSIYASTIVLGEIIKNGGEVYQNAHTPYTMYAAGKPAFMEKSDPEETAIKVWGSYVNRIHSMIESQKFDLIMLDQWTVIPSDPFASNSVNGSELLEMYYQRKENIPISLANRPGGGKYTIVIWEPRKKP
jgi:hypothetical protein